MIDRKMSRRELLRLAAAAGLWLALTGHSPYRQWDVYRKMRLVVLANGEEPDAVDLGDAIARLGAGRFADNGRVPLRALAQFGGRLFVCRDDMPNGNAYQIAETLAVHWSAVGGKRADLWGRNRHGRRACRCIGVPPSTTPITRSCCAATRARPGGRRMRAFLFQFSARSFIVLPCFGVALTRSHSQLLARKGGIYGEFRHGGVGLAAARQLGPAAQPSAESRA